VTRWSNIVRDWGTTEQERRAEFPCDAVLSDYSEAYYRGVSVHADAPIVFRWLCQLRAAPYSYDWIDNDFKPSADQIVPEYQDIDVGDKILMMPGMGFVVQSIDHEHSIVSVLEDGSTSWCLAVYPDGGDGTRLASRWRPKFDVTPATVMMTALAEPGTFIMEQKMLRTIRDRAEASSGAPPAEE